MSGPDPNRTLSVTSDFNVIRTDLFRVTGNNAQEPPGRLAHLDSGPCHRAFRNGFADIAAPESIRSRHPHWFELRDCIIGAATDHLSEIILERAISRIAGVHRLTSGNLFYHHVDFRSVEIDMCGKTIRTFYADKRPFGPVDEPDAIGIDAQSLHHQPHQMPNGNYLALTATAREIENYYTSETDPDAPRKTQSVVGDKIVECTPEGEIIWEWNTFDHLDIWRYGYLLMEVYWHTRGFPEHLDWTHGNGVS